MKFPQVLRLLASFAVLPSSTVWAQTPLLDIQETLILAEDFLAASSGVLGRTVTGDFTGDSRVDVVLQVGSEMTFIPAPGFLRGTATFSQAGSDIVTLPGEGLEGADALAMLSGRGLERWWIDLDLQSFERTSLGAAPWIGSSQLQSGDIDGDGAPDVLAIGSSGTEIMTWTSDPQTGGTGSITALGTIYAYAALDWDGDGLDEIALSSSLGLRVIEADGTVILSLAGGAVNDQMIASSLEGSTAERLLYASQLIGSDYYLTVLSDGIIDPPLLLGDVGLVAMAAGDVNGDGRSDVALRVEYTSDIVLLRDRGIPGSASYAYTTGDFQMVGTETTGVGTDSGWPSLADFDNDGDDDLLFPLEVEREVVMLRSRQKNHDAQLVAVTSAQNVDSGVYTYDHAEVEGELVLYVDPPTAPTTATDVQVVVWRQSAWDDETEPVAVSVEILPGPVNSITQVSCTIESEVHTPVIHVVTIRPVWLDTGGDITDAGPAYSWSFCTLNEPAQELEDLYNVLRIPLEFQLADPSGPPIGPDEGIAVVPLGWVPCFEIDDFPDERPITTQ